MHDDLIFVIRLLGEKLEQVENSQKKKEISEKVLDVILRAACFIRKKNESRKDFEERLNTLESSAYYYDKVFEEARENERQNIAELISETQMSLSLEAQLGLLTESSVDGYNSGGYEEEDEFKKLYPDIHPDMLNSFKVLRILFKNFNLLGYGAVMTWYDDPHGILTGLRSEIEDLAKIEEDLSAFVDEREKDMDDLHEDEEE